MRAPWRVRCACALLLPCALAATCNPPSIAPSVPPRSSTVVDSGDVPDSPVPLDAAVAGDAVADGTADPPPAPVVPATLAASINAFARELHRELSKEKGNLFYSPLSVHIALTMVWAGARGATGDQLAKVLHLDSVDTKVHDEYASLIRRLSSEPTRGAAEIRIANRLWPAEDVQIETDFAALTRSRYGAPVETLNFSGQPEQSRRAINRWVEGQTRERIKDLLPLGSIDPMTRLVLTNAIYFKGTWATPFPGASTRALPFYVDGVTLRKVPSMQGQRVAARYSEQSDARVLELPYSAGGGPRLAMLILLPKERNGVAALERRLSVEGVAPFAGGLRNAQVDVTLPKFQTSKRFTLGVALKRLGAIQAFEEGADFSAMAPRAGRIGEVFHKAFVAVDEAGTEAAAATAVALKSMSDSDSVEVRIDRPFLFAIRDVPSGTVLFFARINDPSL